MNTSKLIPFAVALGISVLDRVTKVAARTSLSTYVGRPVIPGFLRFIHTENPGAAFSFLSEGNPILRGFVLIGVSLAVLVFVIGALWKNQPAYSTPLMRTGLAFVLGGATGNLYDRIFRGTVTDFIEVYHDNWSFPVFNIADSAITLGATFMLLDMLILNRTKTAIERS